MFRPIHGLLVASMAILSNAPTVHAGQSAPQRIASIRVDYSDLDLRLESEARTMLSRLERAAVRACGGNPTLHPAHDLMPRAVERAYAECRESAVARAVAEVNEPILSLVHSSRDHQRLAAKVNPMLICEDPVNRQRVPPCTAPNDDAR